MKNKLLLLLNNQKNRRWTLTSFVNSFRIVAFTHRRKIGDVLRNLPIFLSCFCLNVYIVSSSILSTDINYLPSFKEGIAKVFPLFLLGVLVLALYVSANLSLGLLLRYIMGFLVYLGVAYFIYVTRNLNDPKFKLWNFEHYDFFQVDILPTILLICAIGSLTYFISVKYGIFYKLRTSLSSKSSSIWLLSLLLTSAVFTNKQVIQIFRNLLAFYIQKEDFTQFIIELSRNLFWLFPITGFIFYAIFQSAYDLKQNRPSIFVAINFSLLFAIIFNYTLQLGVQSDEPLLGKLIFPGATTYQISVLFFVYLFFYLLFNRFLVATFLVITSGSLISIANILKEGLRSEPLLITDFVWLKEISLLTSFVEKSVVTNIFISILFIILIYLFFRKMILPGPIFSTYQVRGLWLVFVLGIGIWNFAIFRQEKEAKIQDGIPVLSKLNNGVDINWMGFSKNASYKSLMYVWTKQLTKSIMEKPEDYSETKIQEIFTKYKKRAEEINKERQNKIEDQTVVFILSESFADPSRLPDISLSQDIISNINKIKQETTSGLMTSDFYGGGTANMEIQSLTGLAYTNLSNSVSVMNTEVLPKMSYIPSISSFYPSKDKIAIHLHNGANYSRNIVYKDLKFDTFIALDGTKDKPKQLEFISAGAKDTSTYFGVTSNLSAEGGQFFSVITMQNHIPWEDEELTDITASGKNLNDEENKSLTSYARLLKRTDDATKDFLDELSKEPKKITVLFYGDHLPGLYPSKTFDKAPEQQYQTDYFIWSNYPTEKLNYPLVRSNDFPALVLKQTGSKVSPYFALLTDILDFENQSQEEYEKAMLDLKLLQYDLSLGNSYILKNEELFFKIGF